MRRCVACHNSCIPASAYLTLKLPVSSPQVFLYFLVATSSLPVTSAGIPSDGLHTYVRAWEHRGIPKASSDTASHSLRERLGYVCNPRSLKEGTERSCRMTDELGSRQRDLSTSSVTKRANGHWHAIIASSCR